jgi:hypothetical protein
MRKTWPPLAAGLIVLLCLTSGTALVSKYALASTVRVQYEDTMDDVEVTEGTEVATKAAFLLRFPDFVRWPADLGDTLCIGVAGDGALFEVLTQLANQENERRLSAPYDVAVIDVQADDQLPQCEILVFGEQTPPGLTVPLSPEHPAGTLTVGTWVEARGGAIIHLFRDGDRVRFEIDQSLAQSAGLQISSKLLSLARSQAERSP